MIFVVLAIIAVGLYVWGYKIQALFLFFFFISSGFQLIPEEMTDIGFISKSSDYAFFILLGIVAIDGMLIKNYLRFDNFIKWLMVFGGFIILIALYSRLILGSNWSEIIRTCRYLFFWVAYFVFRQMGKDELERLLKYLFNATVLISILFLLQIILDREILLDAGGHHIHFLGIRLARKYNQPYMIHFFALMALYHNPHTGIRKIVVSLILVLALLGAFHRSLNGIFCFVLIIGYILRLPRLKRIQFLTGLISLTVLGLSIAGLRFLSSKTYMDLQNLAAGNFVNIEELDNIDISFFDLYSGSTFTYRLAHLYERNQYILAHPKAMLFGAGLMTEDSKQAERFFNFKTGIPDGPSNRITQLDSPDISYSELLMRFGYPGTLLYLCLFGFFMVFFYKKRENKYGFFSFLYILLSFGISFFSGNLVNPITFLLPLISYHIIQKEN